tara:strand:+ start:1337 stop:1978 length:642 start_codon:yes stop_codon:yes gene_type:complete
LANKKNELVKVSDEMIEESLIKKHKDISQRTTPKAYIKTRPDGFDYVDEAYMRNELTKEYPAWSWSPAGDNPVQFLGAEWVIVTGVLRVNDNGVMREFFSPGSARVQFKRGKPHTAENVVDIDKNLASANTNGFKRAVNRLGNIADDVYRKQDLTLSDTDIEELEKKMDGLSEEWKDKIMQSILNGEVIKPDLKKVINRIDQLINEEQEKKDG